MLSSPAVSHSEPFDFRLVAAQGDVDELGHISNLTYLRWVTDAAKAHSDSVGLDWDAYNRIGALFVVRKHEIVYLRPALGDDKITVTTWIDNVKAATSLRETRIVRDAGHVELAHAKTLWVLVDANTRRPCRIPSVVQQAFANGKLS